MEIDPLIGELARDQVASSQELVELAARALVAFSGGYPAQTTDEFLSGLVDVGRKLVHARPALAPLFHLVTELYARASEPADLVMVRRALRTAAVEFTQSLATRAAKVDRQAADLLEGAGRVMTMGRSSQVENALLLAAEAGTLAGVVIGEGRPIYEGRTLAERLAAAGAVGIRVVTDAALPTCLPDCDLLLFGADAVRVDGVVTRVGTSTLASAARAAGKPCYVLAGVLRFMPDTPLLPNPITLGDPEWIWKDPPEGVETVYHQLEITPLKPFKGIVLESGAISPYDAEQRARSMPVPPWLEDAGEPPGPAASEDVAEGE